MVEKMSTETISGARIVLECLHRLGVKDIFGYPGGAVIPIYDEIYKYNKINHYFARHEQPMKLTDTREFQGKLEYVLPHQDRERQILLPE